MTRVTSARSAAVNGSQYFPTDQDRDGRFASADCVPLWVGVHSPTNAAEEKDKVEAVISFSPGEYFNDPTLIQRSLKEIKTPVFITCSKSEIKETKKLIRNSENKMMNFGNSDTFSKASRNILTIDEQMGKMK